jgi:hypothetical protein
MGGRLLAVVTMHNLPINELAELLIRAEKETVPDFITII